MSDQPSLQQGGFPASSESTAAAHSAPRVVVVDDDPGLRLVLGETLAKAGFEVSDADSGRAGIELCETFEPDLMLLDINMPGMDGITACAEIRKQINRDFPIIMVTSVDDAASIQAAFDAGATDFILKPINWPLFQRRLTTVLNEWERAQELGAHERRARLLEKVVPEKVMLVSRNGAILEDLKDPDGGRGESPEQPTLGELYGPDIAGRFKQRISVVLKTRRQAKLEFTLHQYGFDRDLEAQFLPDGRERVLVVVQDVGGSKQAKGEIYDLAFLDSITGLPNRNLFERNAETLLVDARLQDEVVAFLSLTFAGLSAEDQADPSIMRALTERVDACLRDFDRVIAIGNGAADPDADSARLACIASNRFMFALRQQSGDDEVEAIGKRLDECFGANDSAASHPISADPRMGIALFPTDGRDLNAVVHAAESATREACRKGVSLCYYSAASAQPKADTRDYGDELRQAMRSGQLELYYQPRLALPEKSITSVEALLRWNHPMRGFVDLREVLYLAKATGLIAELGDWVLQTACEQALLWSDAAIPRIAVNLSQEEFARHGLANSVVDTLERVGLDADRLELEVTEESLLRTTDSLSDLERLKELGVSIVLDDFGTGHSSLTSLSHKAISALKIDASFVHDAPTNKSNGAICEVIVSMAHILGMQAIAEGVETKEQQDFLLALGCDEFQGFHICHPLPAAELERSLADLTAIT